LLAAGVAVILVAVFPPYQDEYEHGRGHSLVGFPPLPPNQIPGGSVTMPDGTAQGVVLLSFLYVPFVIAIFLAMAGSSLLFRPRDSSTEV
jgi:hypothetical protein